MPIMDGYRATHLIRHHAPFNTSAKNIPIVAMTASAIQGDREKCKKAGMDDYLAKPVKGTTLERMLVQWAISGRVPRASSSGGLEESECSESEAKSCGSSTVSIFEQDEGEGASKSSKAKEAVVQGSPQVYQKASRPTRRERQASHNLTLPGTESEGDRAERREEAEEKATALRDEKLVDAAGSHGERVVVPHTEERDKGQILTVDNVRKLEREADESGGLSNPNLGAGSITSTGTGVNVGEEGGERRGESKSGERPRIERRWMDSDRTITGRDDDR
jgi:CheY-like chemotaxis protein